MNRIIQPALLLAALAFVAAPALTPPFSGYDPALFPVRIERPSIQPAGYAFAIWGLIYAWLLVHAVFGLWRRRGDPAFLAVALPLLLASGLGALWLAIANSAPLWAEVVILLMAGFALTAFLRADPVQDRWLLAAPTAPSSRHSAGASNAPWPHPAAALHAPLIAVAWPVPGALSGLRSVAAAASLAC